MEEKTYSRTIQMIHGTFNVTIPMPIANKIGLVQGREILIAETEGRIVMIPTATKLTKKDLKIASDYKSESKTSESKKPYQNPLDTVKNFKPIDKLEF